MTKAFWFATCRLISIVSIAGCSSDVTPVFADASGSAGAGAAGPPGSTGLSDTNGSSNVAGGSASDGDFDGTNADDLGGPAVNSAGGGAGGLTGGGVTSPMGANGEGTLGSVGGAANDETTESTTPQTTVETNGGETSVGPSDTGSSEIDDAAGGTSGIGGGEGSASGGSAGMASTAGDAMVECPSDGWGPGDETITLMHDGVERMYEVHVPPGYTGDTAVPLQVVIHGAHNTPSMVRNWSQMNPVADENGFIVAYPAGLDCWNTGFVLPGCGAADDDVGFLLSVVEDIKSHACIDPRRVYASGISNGSMMAQYMGCQASDTFAAVAGISAGMNCSASRPLPVFYLHGTEDATVGYGSARPNAEGWANRNGCDGAPVETYNQGSTVCETYQGCDDGVEVVFCTVNGMGHCWPEDRSCLGTGDGVDDFDASPVIWEFFERFPLP